MWKLSYFLWAVSSSLAAASPVLVQLTGKQLLKGKVMGSGYSLAVKSLMQCMDACNEHTSSCDGIVFHENIGKCRMINKCAAAIQVDNSSAAVYFSKRPIIRKDGYLHVAENDACVGLVADAADYATGDSNCLRINGSLASIRSLAANKAASNILRRAELSWAWIAENNTGNSVLGAFKPEVLEQINGSNGRGRGCWAINYIGQWRQFPCKNYKLPSLCEVMPFPA